MIKSLGDWVLQTRKGKSACGQLCVGGQGNPE